MGVDSPSVKNRDGCPGIKLLGHRCNAKRPNGTGGDTATIAAGGDDPNKWSIEKWITLLEMTKIQERPDNGMIKVNRALAEVLVEARPIRRSVRLEQKRKKGRPRQSNLGNVETNVKAGNVKSKMESRCQASTAVTQNAVEQMSTE